MDQAVAELAGKAAEHKEHDVAVAVLTPVGTIRTRKISGASRRRP